MNNENINPLYKGGFLINIVDDYGLETLKFDEGTVLIQDVGNIRVFFQLKYEYTYYNEWSDRNDRFLRSHGGRNKPMEILLGSAIDHNGLIIPDSQRFCLAQHVRVPTDGELEWYESLNVV